MAGMQIASLFASIGADTSGLEKGLSSARGSINDLAGSMKASSGSIDVAMIALNQALELAGKVSQAVQKVIDFAQEGAQIQRLADTSIALARTMDMSMADIVESVQSASLGMVSEYEIMQASSRALMLGVGSSAEQLGQLMEVAAIRGRAMGLSTAQAFNDIVTGIGRMSPMILDNLGIVTNADATYASYAASIGKTSGQLTDVEKKQALLNRVIGESQSLLEQTGGLTLDAAGQWEVMAAVQADFFASLKKDASELMTWWPAFWTSVFKAMTPPEDVNAELIDVMPILNDYLISGRISAEQYNEALGYVNNGLMTSAEAVKYAQKNFLSFYETNDDLTMQLFEMSTSWDNFIQLMDSAGLGIGMMTEDVWAAEKAVTNMGTALDGATQFTQRMSEAALTNQQSLNVWRTEIAQTAQSLREDLATAYTTVYEAEMSWRMGVSGTLKGKLDEEFEDHKISADKYKASLDILDQTYGTNYVLEYEMDLAIDDLFRTLLEDPESFAEKAGALEDYFMPLSKSVKNATADVGDLQKQLSALERTYTAKINIVIATYGSMGNLPVGGGKGGSGGGIGEFADTGGVSEPNKPGHAMGGYELAGQPYLVGEAGPELYIPDTNGRVYSNASTGAMLGSNNNGDLLAAIGRLPSASDIALAVRDALLMVGA